MTKAKIIICLLFMVSFSYGQAPFPHISTSTFNAERVAKFGVIDVNTDFLEITNSTQFDNSFIPSIWAHQQSDTRYVLRMFATTNSSFDSGTSPLMMFRTEIRDNLNPIAPTNASFPWGVTAANVAVRPLFGWENGNTQLMRIMANGYVGIGTTLPTAVFHNVGTARFEAIPTSTTNNYVLTTDINGNVSRQLAATLPSTLINSCNNLNYVIKQGATDLTCSQIFDNGIGVGINTIPSARFHVNGSLRFESLADAVNPFKLLGTDNAGNVFEYDPAFFAGVSDADWLKPDGTLAMSINDNIYTNGKVGINTSVFPTNVGSEDVSNYNLFVTGGILTEEVRVALVTDWADFVFAPGYKPDSLEVIEKFIKDNGHLKDIPTAKEVKEDGIELKKMNVLLLQKIEELTLLLIEVNKKVDKQQLEIEKLK